MPTLLVYVLQNAVKAARGDKKRATPHLKRRARLQKQRAQIDGIIDNLEAQVRNNGEIDRWNDW
jgi:hypothetical protein